MKFTPFVVTHQQPVKSRHRASAIAALSGVAIAAAAALWSLPAAAAPILTYGSIDIDVWGESAVTHSTAIDVPRLSVPLGDPAKSEFFIAAPESAWGGFLYGTPTANNERAYSTAVMTGSGYGAAGVSGTLDALDDGALRAFSSSYWSATNTGGAGSIAMTFFIPLMEIAMRGNQYEYDPATVEADLFVTRHDSAGRFIERRALFDYSLDFYYNKPDDDYAIQEFTASDDLLRDSGGMLDLAVTNCIGVSCVGRRVLPFSTTKVIDGLQAGDTLDFQYYFGVEVYAGLEGGGHALYGDPFSTDSGRGLFAITGANEPVGTVPEPASWALVAAGCTLLAWRRRRAPANGR